MAKRSYDKDARYQSIPHASRTTGLSVHYLREACQNGSIPRIKIGNEYRINVPKLLEQLASMEEVTS